MLRRSPRFALLAGVLLLAACSIPVLPPSPSSSPSGIPATQQIPSGALLSIAATGVIPSSSPYGCLASLLIDAGSGQLDRMATWDDARFAVDPLSSPGECEVSGPAIGGPTSLDPGRYRLAGVASIVSDVASPGFSHMPIDGTTVSCAQDLVVLPGTTGIAIHVTFARDGPCTIDVTTD
jgi:hypothetical protein